MLGTISVGISVDVVYQVPVLNDAGERVKRRDFIYRRGIWPPLASPASNSPDKLPSSRSVLTLSKSCSESVEV